MNLLRDAGYMSVALVGLDASTSGHPHPMPGRQAVPARRLTGGPAAPVCRLHRPARPPANRARGCPEPAERKSIRERESRRCWDIAARPPLLGAARALERGRVGDAVRPYRGLGVGPCDRRRPSRQAQSRRLPLPSRWRLRPWPRWRGTSRSRRNRPRPRRRPRRSGSRQRCGKSNPNRLPKSSRMWWNRPRRPTKIRPMSPRSKRTGRSPIPQSRTIRSMKPSRCWKR